MKILIVGGGVAGPALTQFLKDSADITLVDKAPLWGNIGYGINLWGNGQKILKDLGIDQEVLKEGYEIPWNVFEDKKGKILSTILFDVFHPYGSATIVTRSALQQALVKDLEKYRNIKIKLNTTVSNIIQNNTSVEVAFSDGSKDIFDLVVGADGIHSQIRDMVFGNNFLKYYGWNVYVFWAPHKVSSPRGTIEFSSGGKMCFIFPMEDRSFVSLWVATKNQFFDKKENSKEILHHLFSDFKDSVDYLIDAIEDPLHIFRDNLAYVDMKHWYKGRVVLMGDAKHAVSPMMSMGASMALEDAYVLGEELKKVDKINIPLALKSYEKRRDKRVRNFHKVSNFIEGFMMVKSPFWSVLRNLALKIIPISVFTGKIEKVLAEKI
ncbi:MAG TPA: NAD(P)/FAD-dependent oxidoreductase [Candidatus Paceibacterota bacterium]|jgi:2-polyprenyl-6-methoxyphenol hydroxylase-like FAD-dependent oxidoreductase|nr:NAD(P)/FAD-dependent oxidoreductase [Candidatus Paceibacterota bacterium]